MFNLKVVDDEGESSYAAIAHVGFARRTGLVVAQQVLATVPPTFHPINFSKGTVTVFTEGNDVFATYKPKPADPPAAAAPKRRKGWKG